MTRAVARPAHRYINLPGSLPEYPSPSLALIPYSERTMSLVGVANNTEGTANYFEQTGLVVYVLTFSYPMAAVGTGVKRGGGLRVLIKI
jgi:hypothetical protein